MTSVCLVGSLQQRISNEKDIDVEASRIYWKGDDDEKEDLIWTSSTSSFLVPSENCYQATTIVLSFNVVDCSRGVSTILTCI